MNALRGVWRWKCVYTPVKYSYSYIAVRHGSASTLPALKQYSFDKPSAHNAPDALDTKVLVTGGSLVGIAAALFLAHHEVPHVLIEQQQAPSGRNAGITKRTKDILNAVGINTPDDTSSDTLGSMIRTRAAELGAEFGAVAKGVTVHQDTNAVYARITDKHGDEKTIKSSYMIAPHRDPSQRGHGTSDPYLADAFRFGRIFLAGDGAHSHGVNAGIHDVWNLAWKLAGATSGTASLALLDTYDTERRAIARSRHARLISSPQDLGKKSELHSLDQAAELAELYQSTAIINPNSSGPSDPNGQPGSHAPNLPCTNKSGEPTSTLDLFGKSWVLLTEDDRYDWDAMAVSRSMNVDIKVVLVERDVKFASVEEFRRAFGVGKFGASLIRPDGVVAWRTVKFDEALGALRRLLGAQ